MSARKSVNRVYVSLEKLRLEDEERMREHRRRRSETHRGNAAAPQLDEGREAKRPSKRSRGHSKRQALKEWM